MKFWRIYYRLGLVALMDNHYKIQFNRESGDGRYDISLMPRDRRHHGIIMELKAASGLNEEEASSTYVAAINEETVIPENGGIYFEKLL